MRFKRTKNVLGFFVFLLVFFTIVGCGKKDLDDPIIDEPEEETSESVGYYPKELSFIYQLASDTNTFDGTYEEWLESVKGPKGEDGKTLALQVSDGFLQWQYQGDTTWNDLITLASLVGPKGDDGKVATFQASNGYIQWQYPGDSIWNNLFELSSLAGVDGIDGREVDFQVNGGYIQWQYIGESSWKNMVELTSLTGTAGSNGVDGIDGVDGVDGREVDFQVANGYIQWQYIGDSSWKNLVDLNGFSGNDSELDITDRTPTLTGVKDLVCTMNSKDIDLLDGVTAIDPKFGDITHLINIEYPYFGFNEIGTFEIVYTVVNHDGYGVSESATLTVVYHDQTPVIPDEFVIVQNDYMGIKSLETGDLLLDTIFDDIRYIGDDMLLLVKDDVEFYYDLEDKVYRNYDWNLESYFSNGLVRVFNNMTELSGYMNKEGELVLPFIYSRAFNFYDDRAIVSLDSWSEENVGLIDLEGNEIIEIKYDYIDTLPNSFYLAVIDDEYTIFNKMGEEVYLLSDETISGIFTNDQELLFVLEVDGFLSLVTDEFEEILPAEYINMNRMNIDLNYIYAETIDQGITLYHRSTGKFLKNVEDYSIDENLWIVGVKESTTSNTKFGFYNPETDLFSLIPTYDSIEKYDLNDELYVVSLDGILSVIDKNYTILSTNIKEILDPENDTYTLFTNDQDVIGTLGADGIVIQAPKYNEVQALHDGLRIVVTPEGLYGYLDDATGSEIIEPTYFGARPFSEGYAFVKRIDEDFGWNYIDMDEVFISDTNYQEMFGTGSDFKLGNGMAKVKVADQYDGPAYVIINTSGEVLTDPYYFIELNETGFAYYLDTNTKTKMGLLNLNIPHEELQSAVVIYCDQYFPVSLPYNGMIRIGTGYGKFGFADLEGTVVIDPATNYYYSATYFFNDRSVVRNINGTQAGIIDKQNNMVKDFEDMYIMAFEEASEVTMYAYNEDFSLYGLIDINGNILTDAIYYNDLGNTRAYEFSDDRAQLILKDGDEITYTIIDTLGNIVLTLDTYYEVGQYVDGLAKIKTSEFGFYGYIDKLGEFVVQPNYVELYDYSNGFAVMKAQGSNKYGLVDKQGVVYDLQLDALDAFYENLPFAKASLYNYDTPYETDGRYGLINDSGEFVVEPIYNDIVEYDDKLMFYLDGTSLEVNYAGDELYYAITDENEKVYTKIYRNGWILVDGFDIVIDVEYDTIDYFGNGFWLVKKDGLYGLLNSEFEKVIEPQYDYMYKDKNLNDDIITVVKDGLYGLLNSEFVEIVVPQYDDIYVNSDMNNGVITVKKDNLYGLLNNEFVEIVAPQYDQLYGNELYISVCHNDNWGIISYEGVILLAVKYDEIENFEFSTEYFLVNVGNLYGVFSLEKGLIIPVEYLRLDPIFSYLNSSQLIPK